MRFPKSIWYCAISVSLKLVAGLDFWVLLQFSLYQEKASPTALLVNLFVGFWQTDCPARAPKQRGFYAGLSSVNYEDIGWFTFASL